MSAIKIIQDFGIEYAKKLIKAHEHGYIGISVDIDELKLAVDQWDKNEFKEYVASKFPNRSPKILFQLERINHSEYRLVVPEVQMLWELWRSRQAEIDALKNQLIKAGFKDRGGQLLVPPQGKPPRFDLLDAKQAEVDRLQEEYGETEKYLRDQLTDRDTKIANLEYLIEQDKSLIRTLNQSLEEKDKRINTVLKMLEGDLKYVEQDRRENFEFLQMAMIRCLKDDIKALRGNDAT